MDRRPNWGAGQRNFTSLHLEPLAEPTPCASCSSGFVQGLPDDVAAKILERAEGVPLYAVETVRMLVDRGVLVQRDGHLQRRRASSGPSRSPRPCRRSSPPASTPCSTEQRSLLQDAAVLGNTFSIESLAVVHGGDHDSLEAQLRDLVRKEFLSLDTDPRSPERGQYGFVQGLIAEVAGADLVPARPQRQAPGRRPSPRVARGRGAHRARGGSLRRGAPGRSRTVPRPTLIAVGARDWLSRAGQRALSLGSPEQALAFFEQALEVTAAGCRACRSARARRRGAPAARTAYDRALAHLEEAIAYYEAVGDTDAVGRATAKLARVLGIGLGRFSDAIERAERAFEAVGEERRRAGAG